MACVDVPALPLQILLREHPGWEAAPVAVVDRDTPQGRIQWVNEHARGRGILRGMRYAAGLALARDLHAAPVAEAALEDAKAELMRRLWSFSPRIEPSPKEPGIFWLDASGLRHVFPSLERWAAAIQDDLRRAGFHSVVAVGFSRLGSYASARATSTNLVFHGPAEESAFVQQVPIARLRFDPVLRDTLLKLGIQTLGAFTALPPEGIYKRFGAEAHALHRLTQDAGWSPLQPAPMHEPAEGRTAIDYPESDAERLLILIEELLRGVLSILAERHEALSGLRLTLLLDDGAQQEEKLAPASPTRDARQLLGLLRLRLESTNLSAGVIELRMRGAGVARPTKQLDMFRETPRRNLDAVHRAFAKLRAELGNKAVVHAKLLEGHLPEAQYRWEVLKEPRLPEAEHGAIRPLVRRVFIPAVALPPRTRHEPDGWLIARLADGPVEEVIGPQIISGGWWNCGVSRAYHYVRTRSGRWLWIYHDQERRRWFLQGEVE